MSLIVTISCDNTNRCFRTFELALSNETLISHSLFQGLDSCRCSLVSEIKQELPLLLLWWLHHRGSHAQSRGAPTQPLRISPTGIWSPPTSQSISSLYILPLQQALLLLQQLLLLKQQRKKDQQSQTRWLKSSGDSTWMNGVDISGRLGLKVKNCWTNCGHVWLRN